MIKRLMETNFFGTVNCVSAVERYFKKKRSGKIAIVASTSGYKGLSSISGYGASKAALNMLIKTAAIEQKRRHPESIIISLHPGTVDTQLSQPFQKNVNEGSLFEAGDAVNKLINVIDGLNVKDTGGFLAWDGSSIEY